MKRAASYVIIVGSFAVVGHQVFKVVRWVHQQGWSLRHQGGT